MTIFWRTSRQRNGKKTTQKLGNLNTEIVSSTLPRQDQAFERPQRPMESPATPTFMPEVKLEVPAEDVRVMKSLNSKFNIKEICCKNYKNSSGVSGFPVFIL